MPPSKTVAPSIEERAQKKSVQKMPQTGESAMSQLLVPQAGMDITRMAPNNLLSLQRSIGNQAVQRMVAAARPTPITTQPVPVIQRKEMNDLEEEDYTPSNKEIKKEVGLGKRLGWGAAIRGAQAGDWMMNRFRSNKRHTLRDKAVSGAVGTVVSARNRLYEKDSMKDMSRSEKKQYRKEQRDFRRDLRQREKEEERPGMINF